MDALLVLSLLACALTWLFAVGVLAFGPHRSANRALAAFFALVGLIQLASAGLPLPTQVTLGIFAFNLPLTTFIPISYLFVVSTLETRRVAWLKSRRTRRVIIWMGVAISVMTAGMIAYGLASGESTNQQSVPIVDAYLATYFIVFSLVMVAVAIFALVATVSAYRGAEPGSLARSRARAWLIGFGAQDALLVVAGSFSVVANVQDQSGTAGSPVEVVSNLLLPCAFIVSIPLIAYGIAKTQLFDIDLRVKWGAARGAVAALLVAFFFIVEKLVEGYASRVLGVTFGAIAAGLMLFLVPRLNRAADKVADKAAPKVKPTSEYMSFKKLEVYRAAVESALEEGGGAIDDRSRGILVRLRKKLALADDDAVAVEAELVTS